MINEESGSERELRTQFGAVLVVESKVDISRQSLSAFHRGALIFSGVQLH
jgi:hypothetical protein